MRPGEQCAVLNIDKERMRNAPGFDKENWPDMADPDFANRIGKITADMPEPRGKRSVPALAAS